MQIQVVAENLQFPEGPVAMPDGSVILVEIKAGRISRIAPDGTRSTVAETGGGPNGAALGPDGALYVCNNGGRFEWEHHDGLTTPGHRRSPDYTGGSIQRVDIKTGAVTTLYHEYAGARLMSPNDLVFDRQGGFWFTDHGMMHEDTLTFGALYYATIDGSHIKRARRHILSPNGVGLSPEEERIYFADTLTARLFSCEIESPGKLARSTEVPGKVIVTLPGHQGFDSLAVEAGGRICVATLFNGGISSIGADGDVEHYPFPDPFVTNIAFGGDDLRDAWVTCSGTGKLYRCRWPRPGHKLNFAD